MRRVMALAALALLAGCAESPGGRVARGGASAPADTGALDVAADIERAIWNQSPRPWTTDARWALMRRVYDGARYAPLWYDRNGPTAAGRAAIEALCDAVDEAIHPAAFTADSGAWQVNDAAGVAESDLRLTASLLDYFAALAAGQVAPAAADSAWRLPPPVPPSDSELVRALRRPPAEAAVRYRPASPAYASLRAALARYHSLAVAGDWSLPDTVGTLRLGARDSSVPALRRRLIRTGDLRASDSAGAAFDAPLDSAVRRAQRRLGLAADGVVGPGTWRALAVPAVARARILALNLERYRWLPEQAVGASLVVDGGAERLELRVGPEAVYAAGARLDARCVEGTPPIVADTARITRGAAPAIALGRGRTLSLTGRRACVRTDSLARLIAAAPADAPLAFYLIVPTATARPGGISFRGDSTGADARLERAMAPALARRPPPVCGVSGVGTAPAPHSAAPGAPAPRPSAPAPAGRGSAPPAG